MIRSFEDKNTEELFHGIQSHAIRKNIPPEVIKEAVRKLDLLNCAQDLAMLETVPSIKKEGIVRDGKGKYSIPVWANWRLAFRWNNEAFDVELKS